VEIHTFGSNFDTILAVYTGTGTPLSNLVRIASNDQAAGTDLSRVRFQASVGTIYQIAVDGFPGNQGQGSIQLTIQVAPPSPPNDRFSDRALITSFPTNMVGGNVGATSENSEPMHAENLGGPSVWWSWTASTDTRVEINTFGSNFDTVLAVYRGTNLTDLIKVAANDQAGSEQSRVRFTPTTGTTYQIAVDGFEGKEGAIQLNLQFAPPPPGNDDFIDRTDITGIPTNTAGSNVGATLENSEPVHAGNSFGEPSIWWSWMAPKTGWVEINTSGSDFDTALAVYTGTNLVALTKVAASDDVGEGPQLRWSQVRFEAMAGTTYQIAVDGFRGEEGNIQLRLLELVSPKIMTFVLNSSSTAEIVWNSELGETYRIMESTDIITWTQRVEVMATDLVTTNTLDLSLFEQDAFRVELVLEP